VLPTAGEALRREPRIAAKLHFVGMHGAIYRGYGGRPVHPTKGWEYNVWADVPAAQATFGAPFLSLTITPLDTCGAAQLAGADYARVRDSAAPLARAVMENYRVWHPRFGAGGPLAAAGMYALERESSVLFDCVAVYLAYATALCRMERLRVVVTDDGVTAVSADASANVVACAVGWDDLAAFKAHVVDRVCAAGPAAARV
jgi:inosine-uridine nucleoside N-ribohydrolase